jgi:hypothetical protein
MDGYFFDACRRHYKGRALPKLEKNLLIFFSRAKKSAFDHRLFH